MWIISGLQQTATTLDEVIVKCLMRLCALALAALASGCDRFDQVSGMEGLPKELAPYSRKIASSKLPHISVTPVPAQTKPWESKLLGVPYFLKDKRWPVDREGKPFRMESARRKLRMNELWQIASEARRDD